VLPTNNPVPSIISISPSAAMVGGRAFRLTVNGGNFIERSVVRWNGTDHAATFVSSSELTASISAEDLAVRGSATVSVFNPLPGGGLSNTALFTVSATPIGPNYDGIWSGTTSQGRNFGFTVADGTVTSVTTTYEWIGDVCTATGSSSSAAGNYPITNGSFSVPSSTGPTIAGTFTSATTALGSMIDSRTLAGCRLTLDVTWTATKN